MNKSVKVLCYKQIKYCEKLRSGLSAIMMTVIQYFRVIVIIRCVSKYCNIIVTQDCLLSRIRFSYQIVIVAQVQGHKCSRKMMYSSRHFCFFFNYVCHWAAVIPGVGYDTYFVVLFIPKVMNRILVLMQCNGQREIHNTHIFQSAPQQNETLKHDYKACFLITQLYLHPIFKHIVEFFVELIP